MFATLPVGLDDPIDRLNSIRVQMEGLKESKQAVAGSVLTSLTGFAPPLLLALGTRAAGRITPNNLQTVTTNVPGPQFPLYSCGRRMLEAIPYVPLMYPIRVGVAIFSYDGNLAFGVTGDYDEASDIDVLCEGIVDGMDELVALAGASGATRGAAPDGAQEGRERDGDGDPGMSTPEPARTPSPRETTSGRAPSGASRPSATSGPRVPPS